MIERVKGLSREELEKLIAHVYETNPDGYQRMVEILQGSSGETGWNWAVKDAESKLKAAQTRARELESALAVCIERRDSGEPWPVGPETESKERKAV